MSRVKIRNRIDVRFKRYHLALGLGCKCGSCEHIPPRKKKGVKSNYAVVSHFVDASNYYRRRQSKNVYVCCMMCNKYSGDHKGKLALTMIELHGIEFVKEMFTKTKKFSEIKIQELRDTKDYRQKQCNELPRELKYWL